MVTMLKSALKRNLPQNPIPASRSRPRSSVPSARIRGEMRLTSTGLVLDQQDYLHVKPSKMPELKKELLLWKR